MNSDNRLTNLSLDYSSKRMGSKKIRLWQSVVYSQKYFSSLQFNEIEPIEQNVHGAKGVYELVYFMKESKSLDRFKRQAQHLDKLLDGKNDDEVERLVSFQW